MSTNNSEVLGQLPTEAKCMRYGIKREGESCVFNNGCSYPDCLEVEGQLKENVEELAEDLLVKHSLESHPGLTEEDF